jgi:hypothetical protein
MRKTCDEKGGTNMVTLNLNDSNGPNRLSIWGKPGVWLGIVLFIVGVIWTVRLGTLFVSSAKNLQKIKELPNYTYTPPSMSSYTPPSTTYKPTYTYTPPSTTYSSANDWSGVAHDFNRVNQSNLDALQALDEGRTSDAISSLQDASRQLDTAIDHYKQVYGK